MTKLTVWIIYILMACQHNSNDAVKEIIHVNYYKSICQGESPMWCFQVKRNAQKWEYFYNEIEGFKYEWGYNYVLLVEKTSNEHPQQDASSIQYKLTKIISRVAAKTGSTFNISAEGLVFDKQKKQINILNKAFSVANTKNIGNIGKAKSVMLQIKKPGVIEVVNVVF